MPKFTKVEELDTHCWLGYQTRGVNPFWAVKMYWAGNEDHKRMTRQLGLGIPYENSKASKSLAKRKGNALWREFLENTDKGDSPTKIRTAQNVAQSYNRQIRKVAQKNEAAKNTIHLIRGGRGESYWTHEKVDQGADIHVTDDFGNTLESTVMTWNSKRGSEMKVLIQKWLGRNS